MSDMTFIKEFTSQAEAEKFAQSVRGEVVTKYNWNDMTNKMVKFFWVKY